MSKRKAESDSDSLRSFLPSSFGKKQKVYDMNDALDKTRKKKVKVVEKSTPLGPAAPDPVYEFGVTNPPQLDGVEEEKKFNEEEGEDDYDDEIDESNPFKIPYSHEVQMKGHENIVTALGLDPSGARLISGGYDQTIRLWDFNAMDMDFRSFRQVEPPDDVIHTLQYSSTGDRFLMAGSSSQARIYDRDGRELVEFAKGYPYNFDMASTKGHISRITSAFWHPTQKDTIITGSQDSSIRFWDVNQSKKHKQIVKLRNDQGASRSPVMTCSMSHDGKLLVAIAQDGSLQVFPADGPFTRPKVRLVDAHQNGTETSCITFSKDNLQFISRGTDDTLKIWDTRNLAKGPYKVFNDLPNKYAETTVTYSPDGSLFVTGTSSRPTKDSNSPEVGKLVFFQTSSLEIVQEVSLSSGSVVPVVWHPKLNQILAGSSDKNVHVLFDPKLSQKGVLYSISKAPKERNIEDLQTTRAILTPHALPLFKAAPSLRRQREKARKDPLKAHIPEAPQIGPGAGGKLGSSLTASIMKGLVKKDKIDDDPRAALLKYAEIAEKEPFWFKAYQETQPVPIFDTTTTSETEAAILMRRSKSQPLTPLGQSPKSSNDKKS
eukprot:TRINITY_DN4959_c0_g1_i2.p1 TRINITY_DN4959_c0_g1~~TRINITY_DN4959_c0_g1_i2.p1  ORF type:complete len:602 (-),score=164.84 TRINITY_DN4959_c0_g1_i2:214-2019(-)